MSPVSQNAVNAFFAKRSTATKPSEDKKETPKPPAKRDAAEVDSSSAEPEAEPESPDSEETAPPAEVAKPAAKKARADDLLKPMDSKDIKFDKPIEEMKGAERAEALQIKESGKMPPDSLPYQLLTETFEEVSGTTKRLEIAKIVTAFFLQVLKTKPTELVKVTYLFINRLGPDYEGLELGLGESLILKALAESTGRQLAHVKADYDKEGDLGIVALNSRKKQPTMFAPKPLTVREVFKSLTDIAKSAGQSSQNKKIDIIKRLLTACKGMEAKFLVRSLEGKLRIGMAEKSVLVSLAQAMTIWEAEKSGKTASSTEISKAESSFKEVFSWVPNYETIINAAFDVGAANIGDAIQVEAGVPLKPMLAKPTKSITEILDRFQGEEFTCEYKYDGERAQVHYFEGQVKVYSRNMEDMSQRYPDIVSIIPRFITQECRNFILDCEAVAWDREQRKILPFQVLSTRKRKDVEEGTIKVRVHLFAFDVLYLNGESMLQKPLADRRAAMTASFKTVEGEFGFAKKLDTNNTEEIQQFLDQSVKDACEGLMIKMLKGPESHYEPSKRSRNWLKLKKDYLSGVGDSLDLVVLGAYIGRGKRTNFYGGFLLGCYNEETEEFETVCKIGTGFSEANLEEFHKQLSATVIPAPKSYVSYDPSAKPDVWFEPTVVWEVLTADLSLSPIYKAGINTLGKGVSLRFPRFIRVREDKKPEEATSSDQIVEFYERQASSHS